MIFFHADMASWYCALKSCLWLCTEQIHKCFFKCAFPSLINVERDFSTALPNVHYSRPNLINCSNSRKTLFQWGNILSFCGQERAFCSLWLWLPGNAIQCSMEPMPSQYFFLSEDLLTLLCKCKWQYSQKRSYSRWWQRLWWWAALHRRRARR